MKQDKEGLRISVIGAGGVGGYLGAHLWNAGHDVTLVARGEHGARIAASGLSLESPDGTIVATPACVTTLRGVAPQDLIIIAVKSFDTLTAAHLAMPATGSATAVLSIQNGVENEDLLGAELGRNKILGGVAYIFSTIGAPGVIRHTGGTGRFLIGEMDGKPTQRIIALDLLLQAARIRSLATGTIRRAIWDKWIFITAVGGMTASTRSTIGEILGNTALAEQTESVVRECTAIAAAKTGEDFSGAFNKTMEHIRRLPPGSTSSMHYDITHGRKTEIDALNGAAVRFGQELDIPVPANELVFRSIAGPR